MVLVVFCYQKLGNSRKSNGVGLFWGGYQMSGNSGRYDGFDFFVIKSQATQGNQMVWAVVGYQESGKLKEI